MQDWDNDIKIQLNNLPALPRKQQWELGEWIEECHVRPEVADFASLPLTDNQVGDARISLADQAWFIWDGSAWQSMGGGGGGVNSVTALAPISSSGGINPQISLTGVVDVLHGGTGQTSLTTNSVLLGDGTSPVQTVAPGTSGNVLTSDGTTWQSTPLPSSVTSVTASAPLASSGGATPDISLTGVVDTANGGTGLSSLTPGAVLFGDGTNPVGTDGGQLFWDKTNDRLGVGNGAPAETLSVGTSSQFQVDDTGNILRIHDVPYNWPNVPGGASTFLENDGSGNLSWTTIAPGGVTSVAASSPLSVSGPAGTPTVNLTGVVAIANGGTGQSTQTAAFDALAPTSAKGDLVVHNGADNVSLPVGTNGTVLLADSTDAEGVVWGQVNLASTATVTGTLPVGNGGTGQSALTANNVLVGNGTGAVQLIPPGSSGDVLTWNGTNWLSAPPTGGGGGVTSVTASAPVVSSGGAFPNISLTAGTSTNDVLTWNGSAWVSAPPSGGGVSSVTASAPLASSGGATPDISLTGIIPVANGGTGQSSLTLNNVVLGNGTSAVQTVAPGTSGNVLTSNGTTWQSTALPAAPVTSVSGSGGTTGLTLTGGPTGAVTLTLGGTLIAANGGTGQTSYAVGDLLYANTTTTLAKLPDIATGNVLLSGGIGVAPSYGKVGLTTHVSGVLPVGNGGTGTSSTPTNGQLLIGNGAGFVLNTITAGSGISVTNTAGGVTIAATGGAGTVTSVGLSTSLSGLTVGGSPVTGSGTLSLGGTLGVASGGTGQTSYTNGQLLIGNTTGNTLTKATLTAGSGISITNGGGSITITNTSPGTSTPPAGSNTQLQFNNGGAFGASANLTFNTGVSPNELVLAGAFTQTGGGVSITGNANSTVRTSGAGVNLTVDAGAALNLGNTTATSVAVGRSGITTTVTGGLSQSGGSFNLNANNGSQLTTTAASGANIQIQPGGQLWLGTSNTTAVAIGRDNITTTVTGSLTNSPGSGTSAFSLTANSNSSLTTTIGSIAVTAPTFSVSSSGAERLRVSGANVIVNGAAVAPVAAFDVAAGQAAFGSGSDASPGIAFRGNLDTGLTDSSSLAIGVTIVYNGSARATFGTSSLTLGGGLTTITTPPTGALTVNANGALTARATGGTLNLQATGANIISASTNAVERFRVGGSGEVFFPSVFSVVTSANTFLDSASSPVNRLYRTGSSIRYKTDVESIEQQYADLVLNLRPVWFRSLCEGDRKDWSHYGFIAEEVNEVEPRLVQFTKDPADETKLIPESVQYDRVSVLLLDVVKRQKTKLDALEQALQALQAEVAALKGQG